jgi:hypothetical protein
MGQFTGTTFGIGTPTLYPVPQNLWGVQTLSNPFFGGSYGIAPYGIGTAPSLLLQQIAQLLQIVPQQLQQVQLLQQQQLLHLQQLLQWVPAQLQQLQQLLQIAPQQVQQLQQQGQPGIAAPLAFGLVPQAFAGQASSHVM